MVKDSVGTFLTKIFVLMLSLAVSVIINRSLGTDGRGQLALIVLVPQILWILSTFGLDMSNVYFAGREPETRGKLVANSVWLGLFLGTVTVLLVLGGFAIIRAMDPSFDKNLLNVPPFYFFLGLLTVPFYLVAYFLDSIVYGMDRIHVRNIKDIFTNSFLLIVTMVVVTDPTAHWPLIDKPFGFGLNMGIYGATISQLAMTGFMLIYALWLVSKFVKWNLLMFDWNFFIRGLKYIGFYSYVANSASILFYKASMIAIVYYIARLDTLTDSDLGLYTTAANICEKVWFIPGAIAYALLPKITSWVLEDAKKLTAKSSRHTFLITFAILAVLSIFIRPILNFLYGQDFVPASTTFWALVPGVLLLSMGKVFAIYLLGTGKAHYACWFSVITLIINLVLNFILVPMYGIVGSAAATSIAYSVQTIMLFIAFKKESGIPLYDLFLFRASDWAVYLRGFQNLGTYLKRKNGGN